VSPDLEAVLALQAEDTIVAELNAKLRTLDAKLKALDTERTQVEDSLARARATAELEEKRRRELAIKVEDHKAMQERNLATLDVVRKPKEATAAMAQVDARWKPNDPDRPVPPVIDAGTASTQDSPGRPPSDAVVLFDGKDLSQWMAEDGQAAKWKVEDGYMQVVPHSGLIHTRQPFGDCQLHVEFSEPTPAHGESQERGNSGVFLMSTYEIQVLDSYENKTYADGQAGAVYGQYPPLVNASRPPGQ